MKATIALLSFVILSSLTSFSSSSLEFDPLDPQPIMTRLLKAIDCNIEWEVRELVAEYPHLINKRIMFNTLLSYTISNNNLTFSKILLEGGADPNVAYFDNRGSLHCLKSYEAAQLLLDYGADPNMCSNNGCTPLASAVDDLINHRVGYEFIIKTLIDGGAIPDQQMVLALAEASERPSIQRATAILLDRLATIQDIASGAVKAREEKIEEKQDDHVPVDDADKVTCFVCAEYFNLANIKPIPCLDSTEKPRHAEEFLCDNCLHEIEKRNNICPLCRREL